MPFVGVSDHAGWAVLMTVAKGGRVVDRRRVELIGADLPKLPHHHECQSLPVDEAVALVERVRRSADAGAAACFEALAAAVPGKISSIAIRACPPLPETIPERISNYRAQNVADTVMYRNALARAAVARGWAVHWYDVHEVLVPALDDLFVKTKASLGAPWQKDHRVAMAAAIWAGRRR